MPSFDLLLCYASILDKVTAQALPRPFTLVILSTFPLVESNIPQDCTNFREMRSKLDIIVSK